MMKNNKTLLIILGIIFIIMISVSFAVINNKDDKETNIEKNIYQGVILENEALVLTENNILEKRVIS